MELCQPMSSLGLSLPDAFQQVEIDVDYAESSQAKGLIEDLMLPSQTVMDLVSLVHLILFLYCKEEVPLTCHVEPRACSLLCISRERKSNQRLVGLS
jgi:hypothetical protein